MASRDAFGATRSSSSVLFSAYNLDFLLYKDAPAAHARRLKQTGSLDGCVFYSQTTSPLQELSFVQSTVNKMQKSSFGDFLLTRTLRKKLVAVLVKKVYMNTKTFPPTVRRTRKKPHLLAPRASLNAFPVQSESTLF